MIGAFTSPARPLARKRSGLVDPATAAAGFPKQTDRRKVIKKKGRAFVAVVAAAAAARRGFRLGEKESARFLLIEICESVPREILLVFAY